MFADVKEKNMYAVLIFLHLLVSILLVLVVLIQQPQKGGLGTIFGGGESIFGGGGVAPFMAKVTSALAVAFMVTSLGLVLLSARQPRTNNQTLTTKNLERNNVRGDENCRFSVPG